MLPTKGYFQDIECPYYELGCNRPYCHFLHRKRGSSIPEPVVVEPEPPTYKPTPKSELANIRTHIPISYVPDLAPLTRPAPKFNFERPVYKPTPLSVLSSAKKAAELQKQHEDEVEEQECEDRVETAPLQDYVDSDIDFEDLSAEIDLIDEIIEPQSEEPAEKDVDSVKDVEIKERKSSKHSSHSSSRHKNDSKSKHYKSSRHKSKTSKTKDKEQHDDKEKKKSSSEHRREKERDKRKRSKERDKDKGKSKNHSRHSTSSRSKSDSKNKEKEEKHRKENKEIKSDKVSAKEDELKEETSKYDLEDSDSDEDIEFSTDLGEQTLLECLQIFQEYKPAMPPPPEKPRTPSIQSNQSKDHPESKDHAEPPPSANKKRIAHGSKADYDLTPRPQIKSKTQPNAALVMSNRFKMARNAQNHDDEQVNIMNEVKEMKQMPVKRQLPPPSLLQAAKAMKQQRLSISAAKPAKTNSLIDSILQGSKAKVRKIAPVQNVTSIQRAKARIDEMTKHKAAETLNKTPAQSVKSGKRVAHIPDVSLSDLPDVLHADKSKLPVNVRMRFLTMIADECVKLYLIKNDAYTRALNEELGCYEKCKVLNTYKNSAMLAVSRLRKEVLEREKSGLGPIGVGEASQKDKRSGLDGSKFYDSIEKFVLTEEELDIHGYPKESSIPGHAVIKNRKQQTLSTNLHNNQRKCARCKKIYQVDRTGFPMFHEQCVYHPLKKRTLRGEQTYLCCKSNDDTGCATAETHVCELQDDAELEGFQTTMKPERDDDPRSHAVYALDCEMCYTTRGLELTRVTIVDSDCKTVYETLVKPLNPIIDYNTNFSGITQDQMDKTSTSILQVQANILHLCNSKTILIGHSLESDMKALKIVHGTIIDTSVMFPHKMGLPHKRALRMLASDYLKKIIQNGVHGHDSAEDAIACMELVKWKIREEMKVRGIR